MDDYPWVIILAGENEWETYVGDEHYDGKPLDIVLDELVEYIISENIKNTVKAAIDDNGCTKDGIDCCVSAFDNGAKTTIQYQGDTIVSVTVDDQDIVANKDGIIAKVADFFINF